MQLVNKLVLAIALASFCTSAASAAPVVSHVQQTSLYKPSVVSAAGFNVEMYGRPTGRDAAAAIEGLHGPAWAGGAPLKLLSADARPGEGTRLVLIFNGAGAPSEAACEEPGALGGGASGGGLRVLAIYCSGDRMIARGALSAAQGDDYRSAMQSLLAAMFPPQNVNISPFGGGI